MSSPPKEISVNMEGINKLADIIVNGPEKHMDDKNKHAYQIMNRLGPDAALKHMMNPTGDRPLSYGEMRALYG